MRIDCLQKPSNESGRTKSHASPAGQDERQRVVESTRLHRGTVGLGKRRNNHGCKHRYPCRSAHMHRNAVAFQYAYKAVMMKLSTTCTVLVAGQKSSYW